MDLKSAMAWIDDVMMIDNTNKELRELSAERVEFTDRRSEFCTDVPRRFSAGPNLCNELTLMAPQPCVLLGGTGKRRIWSSR